jgi:hypothetical protein
LSSLFSKRYLQIPSLNFSGNVPENTIVSDTFSSLSSIRSDLGGGINEIISSFSISAVVFCVYSSKCEDLSMRAL